MKRKNYGFLFAILLLSLTSLSPSFDVTKNPDQDPPGSEPLKPSNTPDLPQSEPGPISVGVYLEGSELNLLNQMNEQYMKRTGNIVEIIPLQSPEPAHIGLQEPLLHELLIGEGPDVLLLDSHLGKDLAQQGYLMPVEALQTPVTDESFVEGALLTIQWNGFQWGVPFDMEPYALTWEAAEESLEGEEQPPKELQNWLSYSGEENEGALLSVDFKDPYAFAAAVYALGGNPEQPEKEILQRLIPRLESASTEDGILEGGEAAAAVPFQIVPYSNVDESAAENSKHIILADPGSSYRTVLHSRSLAVVSQSKAPASAVAWIAAMTSMEAQREWTAASNKLSVLVDLYPAAGSSAGAGQEDGRDPKAQILRALSAGGEPARLDFGVPQGFALYSQAAYGLLNELVTIEEFQQLYIQQQEAIEP